MEKIHNFVSKIQHQLILCHSHFASLLFSLLDSVAFTGKIKVHSSRVNKLTMLLGTLYGFMFSNMKLPKT